MNKEIKKFIGTDALLAVETDRETAGRLVVGAIDWEMYEDEPELIFFDPVKNVWQRGFGFDLDDIHEAEKAVIEKVGKYEYGEALISIFGMSGSHRSGISSSGICEIATASAEQRLAAMLTALSEVEN